MGSSSSLSLESLSEIQRKKVKIACLSLVKTACDFASKHALELGSSFYAEMLASEPTLPNALCTYMQDVPERTIRVLSVLLDTSETYVVFERTVQNFNHLDSSLFQL